MFNQHPTPELNFPSDGKNFVPAKRTKEQIKAELIRKREISNHLVKELSEAKNLKNQAEVDRITQKLNEISRLDEQQIEYLEQEA